MSTTTPRVDLLALADVASVAIAEHLDTIGGDDGGFTWEQSAALITQAMQAARVVSVIRFHGGNDAGTVDLDAVRELVVDYLGWARTQVADCDAEERSALAFWVAEESRVAAVVAAMGWEAEG